MKLTWIAGVLSVLLCGAVLGKTAQATPPKAGDGRDIVYAARYYLPPGSRGKSHVHLFRIKPDGSGKIQLTRSPHDDMRPLWSPDGKTIAFVRNGRWLCTIGSGGANLTRVADLGPEAWIENLRWSPDGKTLGLFQSTYKAEGIFFYDLKTRRHRYLRNVTRFDWSPDGRHLALVREKGAELLEMATHRPTRLPQNVTRLVWLDDQTLAAALAASNQPDDTAANDAEADDNPLAELAIFGRDGQEKRRLPLRARSAESIDGEDFIDPRSELRRWPGRADTFVLEWDQSTSSGYEARFFAIDAQSGTTRELAAGQSFALDPNSRRLAFAPYYELTPYDTLRRGYRRVVYTSPLKVRDSNKIKTLVSGLTLIHGCDWR